MSESDNPFHDLPGGLDLENEFTELVDRTVVELLELVDGDDQKRFLAIQAASTMLFSTMFYAGASRKAAVRHLRQLRVQVDEAWSALELINMETKGGVQ